MKLLKGKESDIQTIQDLARKSWESVYTDLISREQLEYMLSYMYSEEELKAQLANPNYHYYMIFDEETNEYDGFIGYENQYEENTTKLHRIYLTPESKGKGLGKKSLHFLHEKVKEFGDKRIILEVNKNNPAKDFYHSQGYKIYEDVVIEIEHGFVMDVFLMDINF